MKNLHKLTAAALAVFSAAAMLSGCGSVMDKISGDWTVKTVNGRSPADFAGDNNVYELGTAKNFKFEDGSLLIEAVNESGEIDSQTYSFKLKDNIAEVTASGAVINMEYVESDELIKYSIKQNDILYNYILIKGKTDLGSLLTQKQERGKSAVKSAESKASE